MRDYARVLIFLEKPTQLLFVLHLINILKALRSINALFLNLL